MASVAHLRGELIPSPLLPRGDFSTASSKSHDEAAICIGDERFDSQRFTGNAALDDGHCGRRRCNFRDHATDSNTQKTVSDVVAY